jgi:hypothetical protein
MQQAQESPVWIQPDHLQKARQAPFLCRVEPTQRHSDFVALYTTPARREQVPEPALVGWSPEQCRQLLDTTLAQQKQCADESDCTHMPWCRVRKACQRAAQAKHEPLSVEALGRALVAARLIDAAAINDPDGYDGGLMLEQVQDLHRRLAELAQPQQSPCACWPGRMCSHAAQCAKDALAQQEQEQGMPRAART